MLNDLSPMSGMNIGVFKQLSFCFLQLSASGDTGVPEVVNDPQGEAAKVFSNLGVCVVQQCAKLRQQGMDICLVA